MSLSFSMVLVCYGEDLRGLLDAIAAQRRDGDEVLVVDNLAPQGGTAHVREHPTVDRVIDSPGNLGYAPAVNMGAAASTGDVLLILNPDAIPQDGCLDLLREPPTDWHAWMAAVVLPDTATLNASGGATHFLGFAWVDGYEDPVSSLPDRPYPTGFLSGACLAIRMDTWRRLGGYPEHYFIYHEDVDLSHRLRLAELGFGVLPDARVLHDYEFGKGARKWRLVERNRVKTVIRDYPAPVLAVVAPAMLAVELPLLAVAASGGWLKPKLLAWADVVRWLPSARDERRAIQATRRITPRAFADALVADLDSPFFGAVGRSGLVRTLLRAYWRAARALLPR